MRLKSFKLKSYDIINKIVSSENVDEQINIKIAELIKDEVLMQQISQLDLIRIIMPFSYKSGFDSHTELNEKVAVNKKYIKKINNVKNNVINIF